METLKAMYQDFKKAGYEPMKVSGKRSDLNFANFCDQNPETVANIVKKHGWNFGEYEGGYTVIEYTQTTVNESKFSILLSSLEALATRKQESGKATFEHQEIFAQKYQTRVQKLAEMPDEFFQKFLKFHTEIYLPIPYKVWLAIEEPYYNTPETIEVRTRPDYTQLKHYSCHNDIGLHHEYAINKHLIEKLRYAKV